MKLVFFSKVFFLFRLKNKTSEYRSVCHVYFKTKTNKRKTHTEWSVFTIISLFLHS